MGLESRSIYKKGREDSDFNTNGESVSYFMSKIKERKHDLAEGTLDEIDFDLLDSIIRNIVARCGIDAKKVNIVNRERISNLSGLEDKGPDNSSAFYDPIDNAIYINYDKFYHGDIEVNKAMFIHVLCHELVHGCSRNIGSLKCGKIRSGLEEFFKEKFKKQANFTRRIEQMGLRFNNNKGIDKVLGISNYVYSLLDEGVTEKLGNEIMEEYFKRDTCFISKDSIKLYHKSKAGSYNKSVVFVDKLVDAVSKRTGVSKEVVWQGFVHGKMSGEAFNDKEVYKLFTDMFGSEFLEEVATVEDEKEFKEIASKYLEKDN